MIGSKLWQNQTCIVVGRRVIHDVALYLPELNNNLTIGNELLLPAAEYFCNFCWERLSDRNENRLLWSDSSILLSI